MEGLIKEKRIARITYNSKGWVSPSGREGKSKSLESYEGQHGFGHEEWLFDFTKIVDQFSYGFIESIYRNHQAYEGSTFDIYLFTFNHADKIRYWIGVIRNCFVLNKEQIKDVYTIYNMPKFRKQREDQLAELGLLTPAAQKGLDDFYPVIKFKKEEVDFFDPPIPITDDYIKNLNRYQLFKWHESITFTDTLSKEFRFVPSTPNNPLSRLLRSEYQPTSRELLQVHREISVSLYECLASQFGKENIGCDVPTGDGTFIDMVRKKDDSFIFYEIKTYNDLKKNVREAFGQLMEYVYWKKARPVDRIIIITDTYPTKEAKEYFETLRTTFKIPLYYQQFNRDTKQLSEEI